MILQVYDITPFKPEAKLWSCLLRTYLLSDILSLTGQPALVEPRANEIKFNGRAFECLLGCGESLRSWQKYGKPVPNGLLNAPPSTGGQPPVASEPPIQPTQPTQPRSGLRRLLVYT